MCVSAPPSRLSVHSFIRYSVPLRSSSHTCLKPFCTIAHIYYYTIHIPLQALSIPPPPILLHPSPILLFLQAKVTRALFTEHPVTQANLRSVLRSDCVYILTQCGDRKRFHEGQTPERICELLSPIDDPERCIPLHRYLSECRSASTGSACGHQVAEQHSS